MTVSVVMPVCNERATLCEAVERLLALPLELELLCGEDGSGDGPGRKRPFRNPRASQPGTFVRSCSRREDQSALICRFVGVCGKRFAHGSGASLGCGIAINLLLGETYTSKFSTKGIRIAEYRVLLAVYGSTLYTSALA
jgi:glycosyltransferase involved in cell wall biosynthesis